MTSQEGDPTPHNGPGDSPTTGPLVIKMGGSLNLPAVVFGAANLAQYHATAGTVPLRTVRLALRYGIRAFDTSVYYGHSEVVLGDALYALKDEFPRSSYQLMTKCGRYGLDSFDYSPATIRKTVKQSLERLKTDYLDTVYLHDVEFVCTPIAPRLMGNHTGAIKEEAAAYGLAEGDEALVRGEGDQKVLDALSELRDLQHEGLIKNVGISGFPLPALLRLAILVLYTPPFRPLDVLLSYSHLCLQNSTFLEFIPHFYKRAKVGQLLAAAPMSMGLLTSRPPSWHPAPPRLLKAAVDASDIWARGLPDLAMGYSLRHTISATEPLPLLVGFRSPEEVHECMKVWRDISAGYQNAEREKSEKEAQEVFRQAKLLDWSWASP